MVKRSAGLLMYRLRNGLEVFLVHPGGPFWARKDEGAWMIPKGEHAEGEEALTAAQREFLEETGFLPHGPFLELGTIKQAGGKVVEAWAFEGDCDPAALTSNVCEIEWPRSSGRHLRIPEVDRGAWFTLHNASRYILRSQQPLLGLLRARLEG